MWIKPSAGSTGQRRNIHDQAYAGSGTLTHEPGTEINYYFGTGGGNNSPYVGIGSGFGVNTDELSFITVTRSQSQNICRWYKNGVKYTDTNAGGYGAVTNSTNPIRIGLGYTGQYYLGDIYVVMRIRAAVASGTLDVLRSEVAGVWAGTGPGQE